MIIGGIIASYNFNNVSTTLVGPNLNLKGYIERCIPNVPDVVSVQLTETQKIQPQRSKLDECIFEFIWRSEKYKPVDIVDELYNYKINSENIVTMRDVIRLEELKVFCRKDIYTPKFSDEIQFQSKNITQFPERKPRESPKVAKISKSRTKPKAKMVTYADKFLKTNKHESEIDELDSKTQTDKIFRIIELLANMIKFY